MAETEANHVQYQKDHIHDNKTPTICAVYTLGYVLAITAVGLRFFSRKVSDLPYLLDDWVILVALVLFTALFGVDIWHVVGGHLGRHANVVTHDEVVVFLKSLYVFNPLYTNIIPLVKISILLLYKRLFPVQRVHYILYVLIGILVCFEISTTFVDIFNCHPIAASWDKSIADKHCVVPQTLYMATAGINLATDIIILILPMPLVWRLRLSTKRKIAVSFIFILGSLVCVTTIFRIATFHNINSYDLTWSYIDTAYWTYSELTLSFICACVPTFRPAINHFSSSVPSFVPDSATAMRRWASNSVSRFGSGSGGSGSGTGKDKDGRNGIKVKVRAKKGDDNPDNGHHPTTTFDSLGLAHQGSMPSTAKTNDNTNSSIAGFERIEDPNAYEAKAVFGGRPSGSTETGGVDGYGGDDDDDRREMMEYKKSDIEALPMQGIHVKRELDQTD